MKLSDLWIRNFMRFRKAHVKLDGVGMTLIEGLNKDDESASSNGAGKSTIVDALVWCLYGVTTHEPSAQGDDVVNEKRGKNCEVRVSWLADLGPDGATRYTVTRRRAWKKGGKRAQLKFVMESREHERDLTKGTNRDTQKEIEKRLGMSVATFRHACVFGQGRAYRFSRLTDGEKKAVLDEMLGSEIYARAGESAGDRLAQTERELGKAETALETALESLQDARKRLGKLQSRAKKDARRAKAERAELERKAGYIEAELEQIVVPKWDGTAIQLAEMNETKAHDVWRKAERHADASRVLLRQLETKRANVRAKEDTTCVTCGQNIGEAHIKRQLEAIDEQIETQNHKDHIANEALIAAHKEWSEKKANTKKLRAAYEAVSEKKDERFRLECKLSEINQALLGAKSYNYDELIADETERVEKLRKRKRKLRAFVDERKAEVEQLRFWQQGFSAKGLRSLMLDSCLPFLNAKLDTYTNALTAGNIEVEFKTQRELKGGGVREDFHIEVRNKHGSTKYNMNSIGERAKIDIIVGLALQDMAASRSKVPVNVAFFDEVFDGLDDRGIDRAVQVLSQLQRESAFIISHKSELKTFFSKRILVVKEHGESRLES